MSRCPYPRCGYRFESDQALTDHLTAVPLGDPDHEWDDEDDTMPCGCSAGSCHCEPDPDALYDAWRDRGLDLDII